MATIKSFTSLEQSRKLAEFLLIESADMCYEVGEDLDGYITKTIYTPLMHTPYNDDYIPCWSLAALIGVLPDTITSNEGIAFKLNIKKNIIEYSNPSLYLVYKSAKSDNLTDTCYEMILKLHELNLL